MQPERGWRALSTTAMSPGYRPRPVMLSPATRTRNTLGAPIPCSSLRSSGRSRLSSAGDGNPHATEAVTRGALAEVLTSPFRKAPILLPEPPRAAAARLAASAMSIGSRTTLVGSPSGFPAPSRGPPQDVRLLCRICPTLRLEIRNGYQAHGLRTGSRVVMRQAKRSVRGCEYSGQVARGSIPVPSVPRQSPDTPSRFTGDAGEPGDVAKRQRQPVMVQAD